MNWIRNISETLARKVLRKDLEELNNKLIALREDNTHLRELAYGKDITIVPQGAMRLIMEMLPSCNSVVWGEVKASDLAELKRDYKFKCGNTEFVTQIYIVPSLQGKRGLTFFVKDFKLRVFIPIECFSWKSANSRCWVWDIYRSGIRVVSDEEFSMIMEFNHVIRNM